MGNKTNRRDFMKMSALAAGSIYIAKTSWAGNSPNERLHAAGVGAGGKGGDDIRNVGNSETVVAVADCDRNQATKTLKEHPDAKFYFDFREMLDKHEKEIDIVTVGTPDHIHAPAAVMAMLMGKHVYVQKPLCRTVWECRQMLEVARLKDVKTQMGNQGTASSGLRRGVEFLHAQSLGPARELHVWTNRPIWPQGIHRPTRIDNIPENLNWEMFLGPAPWRPYAKDVYHTFKWRGWWDYGTGALGDMACHTLNMPFWGLKLGYPTSISAESDELYPETAPKWTIIKYEFPAREGMPPLTMTWYDGGKKPPREIFKFEDQNKKLSNSGVLVVGEEGQMYSGGDYGTGHTLLPESKFKDFKYPEQSLPRAPDDNPYKELIAWIKGGGKAMSNFQYSAFLTENVVLGNLAVRLGKKVEWDGPAMKSPNTPEADQLIKPHIPKGWILDKLA